MSRRVVLWRHGRTSWNAAGRFQGQLDVALDVVGVEQAARAARLLAGMPPTALVASDLLRARATAEPLARLTGLPIAVDERLRETHGGDWQGLTGADIKDRDREAYDAWRHGADLPAGTTGERRSDVGRRGAEAVLAALAAVGADESAQPTVLVVVTHGGTARATIGTLVGLPVEHWGAIGGLANCAWSVLEETAPDTWRLEEHNAGTLPTPVDDDVL